MNRKKDPMGRAIADYFKTGTAEKLRVFSPMLEDDEIPLHVWFREYDNMPKTEQTALGMARGRVLDVGAGAGCHTLVLQERGFDITAIDISPYSVDTMRERGVKNVQRQDFFSLMPQETNTLQGQYDTILMLMNGIGIVGTLKRMPEFFQHLGRLLAPNGQLLCDSSDICYLFMDEDGSIDYPEIPGYYGELIYQMQYKDTVGDSFPWLYIDSDTLKTTADLCGYQAEVVAEGEHYDYLARITRKTPQAKKEIRRIEVVAAIIHDDNGHVFATQRGYGEMKDGWEFPGGKIEAGETHEEALQREIMEELDTHIAIERFIKTIEWDYPQFHLTMHCYLCHIEEGTLALKEHEAARWLSPEDLMSVDWLPADKAVVSSAEWQNVYPR